MTYDPRDDREKPGDNSFLIYCAIAALIAIGLSLYQFRGLLRWSLG